MKTTIDLPPDLVREMKLLAVHEGRKLKDVAADLLQRGLSAPKPKMPSKVSEAKVELLANGLPVVKCSADAPAGRMTAKELLGLEQEALNQEDLRRLGHSL